MIASNRAFATERLLPRVACGVTRVVAAFVVAAFVAVTCVLLTATADAQPARSLEADFQSIPPAKLAQQAEAYGSAKQGALRFHRSAAACVQCHADDSQTAPLGPELTEVGTDTTRESIIESILYPSRKIEDAYRTATVLTVDGAILTGMIRQSDDQQVILDSATNVGQRTTLSRDDIESLTYSPSSIMPTGLADALGSKQAFFDVVEYVYAVARGGQSVAAQLRPSAGELALTDDTTNLDHAGILRSLGTADLTAGQSIYNGHCVNCHGADGNQPKLATARAFGNQPLKFGSDPLSMLRTLTLGNGLMAPMRHLSPKERYQVIHFIRERFMKGRNAVYQPITADYLAELPEGTEDGTATMTGDRDYGPVLASQLGQDIQNGLTFRLQDDLTFHYDLHRFRSGGSWTDGFLDLSETQHYRQRGERMPQRKGVPLTAFEPYGWELADQWELPESIKPPRGPVDTARGEFHGHYLYGDRAILHYRIEDREVMEAVDAARIAGAPVVRHTFRIEPGSRPVRLRVLSQTRDGKARILSADQTSLALPNPAAIVSLPAARAEQATESAHANAPLHVVAAAEATALDLGTPNRTVIVRFRTNAGGTLIASTPPTGPWQPDGKSLFIRGGRLVFDIGWVGAITSRQPVADGKWHTATLTVSEATTRLYVDGELAAQREGFRRPPVAEHVLKVGATADNFGGDLDGDVAWAAVIDGVVTTNQLNAIDSLAKLAHSQPLWKWQPEPASTSLEDPRRTDLQPLFAAAAIAGDTSDLRWEMSDAGILVLHIPASDRPRVFELSRISAPENQLDRLKKYVALRRSDAIIDPSTMTHGGPSRWPEVLKTQGTLGQPINGYALDTIPIPLDNPWNAWLRTSALDFDANGRAVVTTHGGDVYLVSGIDASLKTVTWKRYATGLFEPFGVRVVDNMIYVTCRDGIKRLHDFDGNDEADYIEAFWNDDDVSNRFHAYNFDLQTDSQGNFYIAKAGQYTQYHRPGTIMKIPPEGGHAEVFAFGLRTPNGMGKLNDDRFTVSDNQGPWMPAGKISLIRKDGFFGNMPINDDQDRWLRERFDGELPDQFDEPMIWMPQELDNSCGGQVWVDDDRFGPLSNRLLHSSFGKGWLYHLSLQEVRGQTQASIIALPHQWEAGVMRLRVNPHDGQVYGTGLSGWQGPTGGKDGCLQRLRYAGQPVRMIERVRVVPEGVELTMNFPLPDAAAQADAWNAEMWDYKWSRQYGSNQFSVLKPGSIGRDALPIAEVEMSGSRQRITLKLPQLQVCDQLRLQVDFALDPTKDQVGEQNEPEQRFEREIYMTVHGMPEIDRETSDKQP